VLEVVELTTHRPDFLSSQVRCFSSLFLLTDYFKKVIRYTGEKVRVLFSNFVPDKD
jgi:hypothetical protein